MGDRRRTISTNPNPSHSVPSSIPRPPTTVRQSYAGGRQSLAPATGSGLPGASTTGPRPRASIAPSAYASQHGFLPDSQSSSQGSSQPFSQAHGGPPAVNRPEPPMTVGRIGPYHSIGASMSVGRPGGGLRSSMAPGMMGLQQSQVEYAPPSERRTSTYRRQTLTAPNALLTATPGGGMVLTSSTRIAKDPREARQRPVREAWARDIVAFCTENHFTTDMKQLMQPTGAQFQNLFKFLVNLFDSSINFGQGGTGKKFEEEVLATLRMVQYPFTDSISKSHLQAIGSAQSWPNMLAMLHWLVETIRVRLPPGFAPPSLPRNDLLKLTFPFLTINRTGPFQSRHAAFANETELHIPAADYPQRAHEGAEDVTQHAWLQYVGQAYAKFLTQGDDAAFDEEEMEFKQTVEISRQAQRERIDALQAERDELEQAWKELTTRPDPVHAYRKHVAAVQSDTQKCNEYIAGLSKKMENYRMARGQAEEDNERLRHDRDSKRSEQNRLETVVKSQKLTPLELQSLSSEKQSLSKQMTETQTRYRAVLSRTMNLEVDLNNRITQASGLCAEYDEKAQKLGLFDLDHLPAGFETVPFAQEINSASENPVPEGLATLVKPALGQLRAGTKEDLKEVKREDVDFEERCTKVREEIGELVDGEKNADEELRLVDGEKEKLQEVIDREANTSEAELARLQAQVTAVSSTMEHSLASANHRYESRVIERMDVYQETSRLRNSNRQALELAIEQIMTYKEHMSDKTDRLGVLLGEAASEAAAVA
ncbi:hypothetical protein JCM11641_004130 [Rhodosporidiobolus odoratus]